MKKKYKSILLISALTGALLLAMLSGIYFGQGKYETALFIAVVLVFVLAAILMETKITVNEEAVTRQELAEALWVHNCEISWEPEKDIPMDGSLQNCEKKVDALLKIIREKKEMDAQYKL